MKKGNLLNLFVYSFLAFIFFVFLNNSFAATCATNPTGITNVGIDVLSNPNDCPDLTSAGDSLPNYAASQVKIAVTVILGFTSTIALIAFVYAGVVILNSKGKPDKFKEGQNIITYTFIGIIIIIFSYAAANFLLTTVPKITGGNVSNASVAANASDVCYVADGNTLTSVTDDCVINGVNVGDSCGDLTQDSPMGVCMYLKKTYIDSSSFSAASNVNSDVCGYKNLAGAVNPDSMLCKTIGGTKYCLRCVHR